MCAYDCGFEVGRHQAELPQNEVEYCQHGFCAPHPMLRDLSESQSAAHGLHKCAVCAFNHGFVAGRKSLFATVV